MRVGNVAARFVGKEPLTVGFLLDVQLDANRFALSVKKALELFPSLCTVVQRGVDGSVRQTVSEDPLDVYVWDLKGSQYSKEAAANWVGLCPAARTDGSGRPVAFSVGNTPSGKGFFSISISHALVDGWSLYWFVRTVADFYSDRLPVPPTNTLATPGLTGVELTPVKMDAPEPANPAPDGKLYCWEQFNRDTANLIRELCRKVSHLEVNRPEYPGDLFS